MWQGICSNLQALEDVDEIGGALGAAGAEQGGLGEAACLLHDLQHRQLLLLRLQQLEVQEMVSEDSSMLDLTKGPTTSTFQNLREAQNHLMVLMASMRARCAGYLMLMSCKLKCCAGISEPRCVCAPAAA